jgi:hypothetical protein
VCRFAIAALFLLCIVCESGAAKPLQIVTISARDPTSGQVLDAVRVWKHYLNRSAGVVGSVHDGDRVGLVRQVEGAALIQLADGTQGWVSIDYIRELR